MYFFKIVFIIIIFLYYNVSFLYIFFFFYFLQPLNKQHILKIKIKKTFDEIWIRTVHPWDMNWHDRLEPEIKSTEKILI